MSKNNTEKTVQQNIRLHVLLTYIVLAMNTKDISEWATFDEMWKTIKKDLEKLPNLIFPSIGGTKRITYKETHDK